MTAEAGPAEPVTQPEFAHLRAGGVSLVLDLRVLEGSAGPAILHWGPRCPDDLDPHALALALAPALPHGSPNLALRHPLAPMPVDQWTLRPALTGARADGTDWSPRLTLQSAQVDDAAARVQLHDPAAALTLTLELTLSPSGVLEIRQGLVNTGSTDYHLGGLVATLPVPERAAEILDLTGRWCRERSPQRHPLPHGSWVREGRRGRTGHDSPTVLVVGTPGFGFGHGEVWAVHLAWSGDGVYLAERSPGGHAHLGAGERLEAGEVILAPGERYDAPPVLAAYSGEGLDGLSAAFHAWVRARPGHPRSPRKVVLNTWEAVYFAHDLGRLTELADRAAEVGVERFVLDDGWFGDRRHDRAGLGDWVVSPDAWPHGLAPLVEHVRALGMDFGLWVEPEMVNEDSDLYRAHPEWVARVPGRYAALARHQWVLDLARPDCHAYLLERLDALLRDHDIAFLKWDHNRDLVDAGHDARPGVRAQTLAVYRLLDELRARHPHVEIESCASGGGRVDLGILARTDRVWASDTIDALERQHIQRWTGLLLPPELVGSHIGAERAHTTGRAVPLTLRSTTALFGHLGIEWDLTRCTAGELRLLAGVVAAYRQLRPLLHGGRTVRADHPGDGALVHGVVAHDKAEAVFAVVRLETGVAETPPPVPLPGLDAARRYRVATLPLGGIPTAQQLARPPWQDGKLVLDGRTLGVSGLRMPILHPGQAIVVHCVPAV